MNNGSAVGLIVAGHAVAAIFTGSYDEPIGAAVFVLCVSVGVGHLIGSLLTKEPFSKDA